MPPTTTTCDVAVIGAGVFGAWTAHALSGTSQSVVLVDAHGAGHTRASSGGESRLIRMGYGEQAIYTRWAMRALDRWKAFFDQHRLPLFVDTGVLWMSRAVDPLTDASLATLERLGVTVERLSGTDLAQRYPQIAPERITRAVLEPHSGVLMARRAVQAVVRAAVEAGATYHVDAVAPPTGSGRLSTIRTGSGRRLSAGTFVFACGAWLPKMFPTLLSGRISPTRQEVFYFGCPPGDVRFAPPAMPSWVDFGAEIYGMPDLDGRGFKVALDRHGPAFDPDTGERRITDAGLARARAFVRERFPAMAEAPLLESRVCQYENTSNGDFLIDRHPELADVWLVGGGSGHGFKHGPVVGDYVAERITSGGPVEPRFTLATKATSPQRAIF